MSELAVQASFNSGEWAPTLNARVDLQKYRSGAALLENWFVDYRGGASSRPGTKYILQCYKSSTAVRVIPFQVAFDVGYVLEFGDFYIRFFANGSPILETGLNITNIVDNSGDAQITVTNTYSVGDWFFVDGVIGATELNSNYYIIASVSGTNITSFTDLQGNVITFASLSPYISGGTTSRIYTIDSPYAAADLALVKYAQSTTSMVLCHPNYAPQVLIFTAADDWAIQGITFGSTVPAPTGVTVTSTLSSGSVNYAYVVTAVDHNGQESAPSSPGTLGSTQDIRSNAGTNRITWNAVSGASSYNVYKAVPSYSGAVPGGAAYGFIGNTTATTFDDSNIVADYSETPPVVQNPFQGAGVQSVDVTNPGGNFTGNVPTATASAPGAGGQTATLQVGASISSSSINTAITTKGVGDIIQSSNYPRLAVRIDAKSGANVTAYTIVSNPVYTISVGSGAAAEFYQSGTSGPTDTFKLNVNFRVSVVNIISPGAGYTSAPAITFSSGTAAATATLAPASAGNPSVPGFFQQRLVLAALTNSPQTFFMSQPGTYYNFNVSNPTLPTDSISGTLVSGIQSTIKSMVPQPAGLLMFTDRYSWLINGGSQGAPVSPSAIVANAQSFNGTSDVPPIVANFDVLYVQAKGSVIRDSAYNIYSNVYTGTDISLLSSHLFYNHSILEWAFAEEPFKLVQCIRDDGVLLTLTFLKEQEFIGWTHSVTLGNFKSVTVVVEDSVFNDEVDATYFVVERVIGAQTLKYIERLTERQFPNGVVDAWCVDCGIQYDGAPATTFSGAQHLAGLTVTGLADGIVIAPFVMPMDGEFTLPSAAAKVTIGIGYTCDLETLALDLGEPTVQGKVKKINNVDVRVADALGLKIGPDFNHLTEMKDLVRGNVSSMLTGQQSQIVTDLVTGDARTFLPPAYTVPGQYCIRLDQPYPATVLGVFPSITVGDTK